MSTQYTVEAVRGHDSRVWVLQCLEVPGAISETRTLSQAHELMREAISFAADVEEDAVEITLIPRIAPESLTVVETAKSQLAELARLQHEAARSSRAAVRTLRDAGLNGSDSAAVLGVSRQRVSQLLDEPATAAHGSLLATSGASDQGPDGQGPDGGRGASPAQPSSPALL